MYKKKLCFADSFRARDKNMQGQATLQYEDFIGLAMGAHK
jgi:hypothetical protein